MENNKRNYIFHLELLPSLFNVSRYDYCGQYRVCPPRTLITAWHRLPMEATRVSHIHDDPYCSTDVQYTDLAGHG